MSGHEAGGSVCVGIRREDKSPWERRVPITPGDAAELAQQHGITWYVQSSPNRVFLEEEYRAIGAAIEESLTPCQVILGVKEIPVHFFEPDKTYAFFSHVIKGQPHNMPMLQRLLDLGCNLIDYERIVDEAGRRLIFFGRYAGIAGVIETLWALGQRLAWEGIPNPFELVRHAYEYHNLAEAQRDLARVGAAIRTAGIPEAVRPLITAVTGYGNVARGAWEMLDLLPVERIDPEDVMRRRGPEAASAIYVATFREEDLVEPISKVGRFDLQEYYLHPERYRGVFERYVPYLTAVVNAIYWEPRYPRLVTKAYLRELFGTRKPRLRVVGDISCDIEGSMECTVRNTSPDDPAFVYDPVTGSANGGTAGDGVVVIAVDILPSELPRDASVDFSRSLKPYVPAIARADFSQPFETVNLPPEIKRAVIVHHGQLTPDYAYLAQFLAGEQA